MFAKPSIKPSGCPLGIRVASPAKEPIEGPPLDNVRRDSPNRENSKKLGFSCDHSIPALVPKTRILKPFSLPVAIWLTQSIPFTPFVYFIKILALSSSSRPETIESKSASKSFTCSPVTNSDKWKAWVPISPMAPPIPAFAGLVLQSACL